jgi:hypothetical protein
MRARARVPAASQLCRRGDRPLPMGSTVATWPVPVARWQPHADMQLQGQVTERPATARFLLQAGRRRHQHHVSLPDNAP